MLMPGNGANEGKNSAADLEGFLSNFLVVSKISRFRVAPPSRFVQKRTTLV